MTHLKWVIIILLYKGLSRGIDVVSQALWSKLYLKQTISTCDNANFLFTNAKMIIWIQIFSKIRNVWKGFGCSIKKKLKS